MSSSLLLFIIITLFIVMIVILSIVLHITRQADRRKRISHIKIGMSEKKMLKIMGKGYNKSLLKNNRTKYQWRYSNGSSFGSYSNGFSGRMYYGVSKVDIYCVDGYVEEVRPFNV